MKIQNIMPDKLSHTTTYKLPVCNFLKPFKTIFSFSKHSKNKKIRMDFQSIPISEKRLFLAFYGGVKGMKSPRLNHFAQQRSVERDWVPLGRCGRAFWNPFF